MEIFSGAENDRRHASKRKHPMTSLKQKTIVSECTNILYIKNYFNKYRNYQLGFNY